MLIKEYRIPLPLTVEEYRIAQLYMIQKKSRQETHGAGSGVEILINEPYESGPGGSGGQYTYKVYHVGSHLPGWLRAILPSAFRVEEEAWNAYPYTRTKYTCPFVERFVLDVETRYYNDSGTQNNVFNVSEKQLQERVIDVIDLVKDPVPANEYKKEEDPKLYRSKKTGRGPLPDDWVQQAVKNGTSIMCSYKLCKVEFRYWGMQTKIEKFIHENVLRKTMLHAHRQAWAWQDEWYGLTIEDIRRLERQAQEILNKKMAEALRAEGKLAASGSCSELESQTGMSPSGSSHRALSQSPASTATEETVHGRLEVNSGSSPSGRQNSLRHPTMSVSGSQRSLATPTNSVGYTDHLHSIRADSSDEEFFDASENMNEIDTPIERPAMVRWSSVEMLPIEEDADGDDTPPPTPKDNLSLPSSRLTGETSSTAASAGVSSVRFLLLVFHGGTVMDTNAASQAAQPKQADVLTLKSTFDHVIRTHYNTLLGRLAVRLVPCSSSCIAEALAALANICPYGAASESGQQSGESVGCCQQLAPALIPLLAVSSLSYDDAIGAAIARANQVFQEFLNSEEGAGFGGEVCIVGDSVGGLLAYDALVRQRSSTVSRNPSQTSSHSDIGEVITSIPEDDVLTAVSLLNEQSNSQLYDGQSLNGVSSSTGQLRLPRVQAVQLPLERSASSPETEQLSKERPAQLSSGGVLERRSVAGSYSDAGSRSPSYPIVPRLNFRVSQLFLCGTPLGLMLTLRRMPKSYDSEQPPIRPLCSQVYNMYYAIDPCCTRLEPLLIRQFGQIAPVNVPRYQRFPLGDGQTVHVLDCLQKHSDEFQQHAGGSSPVKNIRSGPRRRLSGFGLSNGGPGAVATTPSTTTDACSTTGSDGPNGLNLAHLVDLSSRWWGSKRMDYALYCPEGLTSFPTAALPNFLHASYWESSDVVAFILRQFIAGDVTSASREGSPALFCPTRPTEKWLRRRTSFKIKNSTANHRGNDVIVAENQPQILQARFMYGPLDVVALTGEKVDIYIMEKPSENGEWALFGTETTDSHGRLSFTIPPERQLPHGLYPVKMVVRGDHTYQDMYLAVIPPKTECVVFSIDGSFTASVSVSGKDPKVRPGAVDVVRHWQDLGYLILYVTARPDMQQRRVLSWLAQHNFPHGLLFFTDGISTDPLRQKTNYLKRLVNECGVYIQAGYGSAKDVHMYKETGLSWERIFVVGKASAKKLINQAVVVSEGYAAHLNTTNAGAVVSRPAQGNGRLIIRKQSFGLPGQYQHRAVAVQRSHSFTPKSATGASQPGEKLVCQSLTVPYGAPSFNTSQQASRSPSPFTRLLSRKGRQSQMGNEQE